MLRDPLTRALQLAQSQKGKTAPNPAVGAVLIQYGEVIGEGCHHGPGTGHAEVEAFADAEAKGITDFSATTLYVTLEPCCHFGRTPPCTELITSKKVPKVVFGYEDPNPVVRGKGRLHLQSHGVTCEQITHKAINEFYESYRHWTLTKTPWVTVKIATSLDGKVAHRDDERLHLTNEAAMRFTHQGRRQSDAILTTSRTIVRDNPQLNVRLKAEPLKKPLYIVDRKCETLPTAQIFSTTQSQTFFHAADFRPKHAGRGKIISANERGLEETEIFRAIGEDGVHDLWVECGPRFFQSLAEKELVHRLLLLVAPRWVGERGVALLPASYPLAEASRIHWRPLGEDALCELTWYGRNHVHGNY